MIIRFLILIAFDIAIMSVIAQTASFSLTVVLVVSLLFTNLLLAYMFSRIPSRRTDPSGCTGVSPHWSSWTDYIPVLGGTICIFIGVPDFSWKPCVIGVGAVAFGVWRIRAKRAVQKALRDRR